MMIHLVGQFVGHLGHDEARSDGVAADAGVGVHERHVLRQAYNGEFRGRVGAASSSGAQARQRRGVDDDAAFAALHEVADGFARRITRTDSCSLTW